jgi:uncharacterized membrane protein YfcA
VLHLDLLQWLVALAALFLVGWSKTAVGVAGTIGVALFALVFPAKESTGILLPLLIVGDFAAVRTYRQHVNWSKLRGLFPWVGVGVGAGAFVVHAVNDAQMRRLIGSILLVMLAAHLWNRRRADPQALAQHPVAIAMIGVLAGFATMVANSAGPITTLYLLAAGLSMLTFLGTTAWFYFLLNSFKLPFSVALGLITPASLVFGALTFPVVLLGTFVGRRTIDHINPRTFERISLVLTLVVGVRLIL